MLMTQLTAVRLQTLPPRRARSVTFLVVVCDASHRGVFFLRSFDPRPPFFRVGRHIRTTMAHFYGRVDSWDVVNEALAADCSGSMESNVFLRKLGPGYVDDCFRVAHQVCCRFHIWLFVVHPAREPFRTREDALTEGLGGWKLSCVLFFVSPDMFLRITNFYIQTKKSVPC